MNFTAKNGVSLGGVTLSQYEEIWKLCVESYALLPLQMYEAASFSMAMVVRSALGLSAYEGKTIVVASDSAAGCVALASLRHLYMGGADGIVIFDGSPDAVSEDFSLELQQITSLGIPWVPLSDVINEGVEKFLENCHNLILGNFTRSLLFPEHLEAFISTLNEAQTPIHCIEAPLGVNVDTGKPLKEPLFASSTLSLGLPLIGLQAGIDFVGRHYLCDVSFPPALTEPYAAEIRRVFAEQPVVQLSPAKQ